MDRLLTTERTTRFFGLIFLISFGLAGIVACDNGNGAALNAILFTSDLDGNKEIYRMVSDGSAKMRLTSNQSSDSFAKWSPDRKKIVFESRRDGNSEIYVMNSDGSGQTNLTNNAAIDGDAVWSRDGSQIAFVSDRAGNEDIYLMKSDGSGQTQITFHNESDHQPAWSPDGQELAFASGRDGNVWTIWVKDLASGNLRQITRSPLSTFSPTWSPDGTEIAFVTAFFTDPEQPSELRKIKVDGSTPDQTVLASNVNTSNLNAPVWSSIESPSVPGRVLYVGSAGITGKNDIHVVNSDGTNDVNLTQNDHSESSPVWGTLEHYVAFVSSRHGPPAIYRMKASDGTEQILLTDNNATNNSPDW
jgi:Tol biopolymer transport system component